MQSENMSKIGFFLLLNVACEAQPEESLRLDKPSIVLSRFEPCLNDGIHLKGQF